MWDLKKTTHSHTHSAQELLLTDRSCYVSIQANKTRCQISDFQDIVIHLQVSLNARDFLGELGYSGLWWTWGFKSTTSSYE